jgi:hypothetical protein
LNIFEPSITISPFVRPIEYCCNDHIVSVPDQSLAFQDCALEKGLIR